MRPIVMIVALAACSEPQIEDYDATCEAPEDCVAVVDQAYCGYCSSWGALSVSGAAEFEADQERFSKHKSCRDYVLIGCFELGDPPEVTCGGEGTCVIE